MSNTLHCLPERIWFDSCIFSSLSGHQDSSQDPLLLKQAYVFGCHPGFAESIVTALFCHTVVASSVFNPHLIKHFWVPWVWEELLRNQTIPFWWFVGKDAGKRGIIPGCEYSIKFILGNHNLTLMRAGKVKSP